MTNSIRTLRTAAREPRRVGWLRLALIGTLAVLQETSEIVWNRMFRVPDGRTFVTDGAIMLDAELAGLPEPPSTELPASTGEVMARYMAAERANEIELDDLERGAAPQTYEAPNGLPFAAKYVEYLREVVPDALLRVGGDLEPVVIVDDGEAVGLVMAMARARPE
jgi:hypothetical protein